MKLKQLESMLGDVSQFAKPKIDLEQYPTGPHIASRMVYMAENSFGDISGKVVADFGCGCGTLGIAAALLEASYVVGVDIDYQALEMAQTNMEELEVEMELVLDNIQDLSWRGPVVDTVIMNPPFGTRRKGADMEFLSAALKHVQRGALRDLKAKTAEVLCELRYDLPASYKFHKKREVDIAVDLWRFTI
ncbi:hypothetical protein R1sor_015459 [Riccia sorocarpa]|uniref:Methyltransferase-like protein 5 n=1 Tax=Riccia sorocarpa TaxID=122646 RepID=A0ABD3HG67_9MARC